MPDTLEDRRILIVASDGFEHSELFEPLDQLRELGATVEIASPEGGVIKSWLDGDWGDEIESDLSIGEADSADYDALILPGGVINPDKLRTDNDALDLIRSFYGAEKPIAAICHAPWLLIEAGLAEGVTMTGYDSILTDLRNAGANVVDRAVAQDQGLITSRSPQDLDDFVEAIADALGVEY
ncbi:type 1 glutamine amidotransferase domain-containing protein [Paracoccus pacificus]|uniref:Type 1 glutamine amidotransferase domain-containing protein n=1 Tax=Paracoccus pacificus TaxID=1463598 RepID=A0ABW4R9Z4_9RHOB